MNIIQISGWFVISSIVSSIISSIILMYFYRPFRFYCYSFFFLWLNDHPRISKFLGIRYEEDSTWHTNRKESKVYLPGIIGSLIKLFIGTDFFLGDEIRKTFERVQQTNGKNFDMNKYFEELVTTNRTLTLSEFEDFLSKSMIKETNRVYEIISDEQCECFVRHSKALRTVISALTFSVWEGLKALIPNFHHVIKMSLILRSAPEHTRVLLLAPQLTLIHNFTNMIINKKGDMSDLEPHHFLEPVSKLFVAESINSQTGNPQLVFVSCKLDTRNTANNIAFWT